MLYEVITLGLSVIFLIRETLPKDVETGHEQATPSGAHASALAEPRVMRTPSYNFV